MKELTKEQEDQVHDLPHHEKKFESGITISKDIQMDPEYFRLIRKKIGREKLDVGETHREVLDKIAGWHKRRCKNNNGR